jgi:hypothetical protein
VQAKADGGQTVGWIQGISCQASQISQDNVPKDDKP